MQAGTATVVISVNYLDDFQQPQVITQRLSVEIEEGGAIQGENGTVEGGDGSGFAAPNGAQSGFPLEGRARGGAMTVGQRAMNGVLGFFGLATRQPSLAGFEAIQSGPQQ
jgi:hypothetical protein